MKFSFKKKTSIDKINDPPFNNSINLHANSKEEDQEKMNMAHSPKFYNHKIQHGNSFNVSNVETKEYYCIICKNLISGDIKKPHWKWNMNSENLCVKCFDKKSTDYEKIINYCISCNEKLRFIRYNPKPLWNLNGQLCRICWDKKNVEFNAKKAD